MAKQKLSNGEEVSAYISPEPTNIEDENAIAVYINYGLYPYLIIGYIAKELTRYIHPLLANNSIISVSLEEVKFRVTWAKTGYYAKLSITRKGQWPGPVIRASRGVQ